MEDIKGERDKELSIFSKSVKELREKIKPSDSNLKACEFAMEFENSGYRYYNDAFKSSTNELLKRFFEFLLAEEKKHYDIIENLHTYLSDSENWFMYEEGSFPQGG